MKRSVWPRVLLLLAVPCFIALYLWAPWGKRVTSTASFLPEMHRFAGLRFDPSFFYGRDQTARELASELVARWQGAGLNAVLFRAYDPSHGASYRTDHPHNRETDFGRLDLLGWVLKEAHRRGMKVYAWLTPLNHAGAWEAKKEWRALRPDRQPYRAQSLPFPLCPRQPGVREWWRGFVADLFDRHPDLDGLDLAEPALSWRETEACYCDLCAAGFQGQPPGNWTAYRAGPLADLVLDTFRQVRARGKETMLTTVLPAGEGGEPLPFTALRDQTALDLDAVLASPDRPRFLSVEVMWQEWAGVFPDGEAFKPAWAKSVLEEVRRRVAGRASVIGHLELTEPDGARVRPEDLAAGLAAALEGGAEGFEVYDAALLEKKGAWGALRRAATARPRKKVLILYHPDREGEEEEARSEPAAGTAARPRVRLNESDAWQLATLCGHFACDVEVRPLESYAAGEAAKLDALCYLGVSDGTVPAEAFLKDVESVHLPVLWLGANLQHLLQRGSRFGLDWVETRTDASYASVRYQGKSLLRGEPLLNVVRVSDQRKATVLAETESPGGRAPYAIRSGNLWYFADDPLSYAVEGGCYVVLADLLHDVLGEEHAPKKLAMVRLEDVHPLTPPRDLRAAARFLHGRGVPFLISLVPIYRYPKEGENATLADQPEFVEAIQEAVSLGGTVVLHGVTHQLSGESTADYEFWDTARNGAPQARTDAKTRARVIYGLEECLQQGIYPLLWETPHYASTVEDYQVFSSIFSTSIERRQSANRIGSDQLYPYPILRDRFGSLLLPENLGYVPLEDQRAAPLLEAAERTAVVRDATVCFFFHLFCDLKVLKEIVSGLQDRGFEFPDTKSLPLSVAGPGFGWSTTAAPFPAEPPGSEALLLDSGGEEIWRGETAEFPRDREPALGMRIFLPAEEKSESPGSPGGGALASRPLQAGILAPGEEGERIAGAIRAVAARATPLDLSEQGLTLAIVSEEAAHSLAPSVRLKLASWLSEGGALLTWGRTPLAEDLGVAFSGEERTITEAVDLEYGETPVALRKPAQVAVPTPEKDAEVLVEGKEEGVPLLTATPRGKGRLLYSALPPFGPPGGEPYPYLFGSIRDHALLAPACRSKRLEVYFDPGNREKVSKEDLVKRWSAAGVRVIHAAGWLEYRSPEDWTYEYEELIGLAHQNAMLVYAWLPLPYVSEKFWEDHSQWREKNPQGGEVKDWRKASALVDPECREAVKRWVADFLGRYDFDGVNLAGLSFGGEAWDKPETLSPFSEAARRDFGEKHGFDPREIWNESSPRFWKRSPGSLDPFLAWRKQWTTRLHREFLALLAGLPGSAERTVVVSLPDAAANPDAALRTGVDLEEVLKLRTGRPFLVQIMDAASARPWDGERFPGILRDYSGRVDPSSLVFQIDVTQEARQAGIRGLSGIPLYRLLASAGDRPVAIYSEDGIADADWPLLASALAASSATASGPGGLEVSSAAGARLPLEPGKGREVRLDGKPWQGVGTEEVLVPPGAHRLEIKDLVGEEGPRLADASSTIVEATAVTRGIRFVYESRERVWTLLNREAVAVTIDGRPAAGTLPRGERGWPLLCPPGRHEVVVVTESLLAFAVRVGSLALSGGIVAFSGVALGLVAALFLWARHSQKGSRQEEILIRDRVP